MKKPKQRVKVGDIVQYNDGTGVVCDEEGMPLRVIEIRQLDGGPAVIYNNGTFDWYNTVEKIDPLLLELL